MQYFALFTGIIFLIYLLGSINQSEIGIIFMDRNFTAAVKGFAILTVVWAHLGASLGVGGIQFIAGVGVALFLICSGYGLEISYQKNGLKDFWKKRIVSVCIPFWIVELTRQLTVVHFKASAFITDFFFISSPWFIQYIMICYVLFFLVKRLKTQLHISEKNESFLFVVSFGIWFVVDSIFFANLDMPFLRARQMLSFPVGTIIGKHILRIRENTDKRNHTPLIWGGAIMGITFMAITQLPSVKNMPYIISNLLSLYTVLPLAIAVLALGAKIKYLFNNWFFILTGKISYEIYLLQSFTLMLSNNSITGIAQFVIVTAISAVFLYIVVEKGIKRWLI